jgi:hypothetical protein
MSNKINYLDCSIHWLLLVALLAQVRARQEYPKAAFWMGLHDKLHTKIERIIIPAQTQRYELQASCLDSFTITVYYCANSDRIYCATNHHIVKDPRNQVQYSIRLDSSEGRHELTLRPVNIPRIDGDHF